LTSLENHEGNFEHSSSKLTYGKDQIEWRRSRVLELSSEGYTQREIASKLQIGKGTVTNDLLYLKKQAQENLQKHIHEVVPEEYQKCMVGMKHNLKHILEIAETATDPKIKLQAPATANDCYKYIMDLATNGVVITDAVKLVQTNKEKLAVSANGHNNGRKESNDPDYDEELEEKQEDKSGELSKRQTTNRVF
jgi:hypothetical protein